MKIKRIADLSFPSKIRIIIIGTTVVALLLFAAVIIGYEVVTFRHSTVTNLAVLADIIGASIAPALLFEDERYGERILGTLTHEKNIMAAAIFRANGSLFATYNRDPLSEHVALPTQSSPGYHFTPDFLEMCEAVISEGDTLGTIYIKYDLQGMKARLVQYFVIISAILLASCIIAFAIASRMQGAITKPILHLARIASTVTREKDYSIRAETGWAEDEVGRLAHDFNQMLARIEERDKDLEHRVDERTLELKQALSELQKLDMMKTDFFTTMSHELRTPLTSIMGFAKIIKKRIVGKIVPRMHDTDALVKNSMADISEDLDIILWEGEKLTNMINNILDLAKLEEEAVAWKDELFTPAELVERSVSTVKPLLREKGLAMSLDIEDGLPAVQGDKDRLTQVMTNLLANAVKFTSAGSVTCRVRSNHHEMVISVSDTGTGISEQDHERLFSKYHQGGDAAGNGQSRGTGLGLSICKHIVEHHRGRIWAESAVGKGSTFSFTLPLHEHQGGHAPVSSFLDSSTT